MAELCDCSEKGIGSLRQEKDCKKVLQKVVAPMPIQRKDGGIKASIDVSTVPVPESLFQGMFLEPESGKRLHVIYDIKNTAFEPQDGVTVDWEDGTSSTVRDGNLQMTFIVAETNPIFNGNVKDLDCKNPDTYLYLADGSIVGYADRNEIASDQKVYPLPVQKWTTVVTPIKSDTGVPQVAVTIDFPNSMSYKNWVVIAPDEHDFDISENYEAKGALLVQGTAPTTATSLEVKATLYGYGILGNSSLINGLGIADFLIDNNGTPVTILTATASATGYVLTFASQTSGDTLITNLAPASGYVSDKVTTLVP